MLLKQLLGVLLTASQFRPAADALRNSALRKISLQTCSDPLHASFVQFPPGAHPCLGPKGSFRVRLIGHSKAERKKPDISLPADEPLRAPSRGGRLGIFQKLKA
jgi:hypothetical protein